LRQRPFFLPPGPSHHSGRRGWGPAEKTILCENRGPLPSLPPVSSLLTPGFFSPCCHPAKRLRLEDFKPRTRRRASSTCFINLSSTLPRRLASRSLEIVRICSHLHHEFSERPFDPSGVNGT